MKFYRLDLKHRGRTKGRFLPLIGCFGPRGLIEVTGERVRAKIRWSDGKNSDDCSGALWIPKETAISRVLWDNEASRGVEDGGQDTPRGRTLEREETSDEKEIWKQGRIFGNVLFLNEFFKGNTDQGGAKWIMGLRGGRYSKTSGNSPGWAVRAMPQGVYQRSDRNDLQKRSWRRISFDVKHSGGAETWGLKADFEKEKWTGGYI